MVRTEIEGDREERRYRQVGKIKRERKDRGKDI